MKKVLVIILTVVMCCVCCGSESLGYSLLYNDKPIVDKSQAEQFLKDRHASKKMLNCLDFIYEYSEEVGIDPGVIIAMSSIETGYGKSHLFVAHNNPGGIKSSRTGDGWAHYDSAEDGYRGMINLLATYAGLRNPNSYLYGVSKTTQGLAGIYWTNYGNDKGYHGQLSRQIKTMRSYPIKKQEKKAEVKIDINKPQSKDDSKADDIINDIIKPEKEKSGIDIIYDILNRGKSSNGYDFIMKFLE